MLRMMMTFVYTEHQFTLGERCLGNKSESSVCNLTLSGAKSLVKHFTKTMI